MDGELRWYNVKSICLCPVMLPRYWVDDRLESFKIHGLIEERVHIVLWPLLSFNYGTVGMVARHPSDIPPFAQPQVLASKLTTSS
jgi:hypothetical protein